MLEIQKSPAFLYFVPFSYLPNAGAGNPIGIAPINVQFSAADYCVDYPMDVAVTNWVWTFGDGSASTNSQFVSHVYIQPGTFNEQLSCVRIDGVACNGDIGYYPSSITTVGTVMNVRGTFTGLPAGFTLTNGVLLAMAGSFAGQAVPEITPLQLTSNSDGSFSFGTQLDVPLTLNKDGTYSMTVSPSVPNNPAYPGSPIYPNATIMFEYNDGLGHTGVLIGNLGMLNYNAGY